MPESIVKMLDVARSGILARLQDLDATSANLANAGTVGYQRTRSNFQETLGTTDSFGGALARVGEDDTAFGQRDTAHNVNINAVWTEEDPDAERHIAWARDFFDALQPHAGGRVYVNFLGDEGPERVREAYGRAKYTSLARLKHEYDPDNFFRLNNNIPPPS